MAEGRCTLYNTLSCVKEITAHPADLSPAEWSQWEHPPGTQQWSCLLQMVTEVEYWTCTHKCAQRQKHKTAVYTSTVSLTNEDHISENTKHLIQALADKRLQLCPLLYMLCISHIHMHNTCCTTYIHACLHTHIHTHMHKYTRRVFFGLC